VPQATRKHASARQIDCSRMNRDKTKIASQPRRTFADVAALIAPESTPSWLPAHLEWSAQGIRHDRLTDVLRPTKAETLKELSAVEKALATLWRGFNSPAIRNLLEDAKSLKKLSISGWDLQDLSERAALAVASPLLIKFPGKARRGRGKPKVPNLFDAKTLCAARIVDLWKHFRGSEPGLGNLKCADAAQAYWLASGGRSEGYGDPLNGWYDYFKIVRENEQTAGLIRLRRIWIRDLEQAERRGRPPWFLGTYFPVQEA
jgi:hypothetical protein